MSRAASEKEKAKDLPTLKDNDFLEDNVKLFLPDVSWREEREECALADA